MWYFSYRRLGKSTTISLSQITWFLRFHAFWNSSVYLNRQSKIISFKLFVSKETAIALFCCPFFIKHFNQLEKIYLADSPLLTTRPVHKKIWHKAIHTLHQTFSLCQYSIVPKTLHNRFHYTQSHTPAYRAPLSYGIPSAFGACEFFEVSAKIIIDAINGIML